MENMSYCRFENTWSDLVDCYNELENGDSDLSSAEKMARLKLIKLCVKIANCYGDEVDCK